jgi:NADPH-dependent 2,4-dienoyl-CoA reductase/sulfur reductase-like enzyme/nitrite reductase/ring-hydroxylating ferredoxin subunit
MPTQEAKVAHFDDLSNGQMKEVAVGERKLLLARHQDQYYATAAHCTHYGAPLAQGALNGKRVVCPWHHACFDITNGDQMEPPGCDSLPRFETEVRGDEVFVKVPEDAPEQRMVDMTRAAAGDQRTWAIIGGGAAAQYAAEAMRASGFTGRITMISRDKDYPYDRVNCSKAYLQAQAPEEWMPLRSPDFYETYDIDLLIETEVQELDVNRKTIKTKQGETITYDKVLICTGGQPRQLDIPGKDLENVYTLRSLSDSSALQQAARNVQKAVVVGSSFIGMEGAWSLAELGCEVTVVTPETLPFAGKWGEEAGHMMKALHEEKGIRFVTGVHVSKINGNARAEGVTLDNGKSLKAGLVLLGVGVSPATSFIRGLELAEDGGIRVDETLHAGQDVYAAGDIAHFPYKGESVRIEHWRLACQHGRLAGENMTGPAKAYEGVPFFWTAQQGAQIRYLGYAPDFDRVIINGDMQERSFIAFYVKDGIVKAALGLGRDKEMAALHELIRMDRVPPVKDLDKHQIDLEQHLREVASA